jgi:hypothetical protein
MPQFLLNIIATFNLFLINYKVFNDGTGFAIVNNYFLLIFDKPLSPS